jgi:hypothetical protein
LRAKQLHVRKGNIKYPEKDGDTIADQNPVNNSANDFVIAFKGK